MISRLDRSTVASRVQPASSLYKVSVNSGIRPGGCSGHARAAPKALRGGDLEVDGPDPEGSAGSLIDLAPEPVVGLQRGLSLLLVAGWSSTRARPSAGGPSGLPRTVHGATRTRGSLRMRLTLATFASLRTKASRRRARTTRGSAPPPRCACRSRVGSTCHPAGARIPALFALRPRANGRTGGGPSGRSGSVVRSPRRRLHSRRSRSAR